MTHSPTEPPLVELTRVNHCPHSALLRSGRRISNFGSASPRRARLARRVRAIAERCPNTSAEMTGQKRPWRAVGIPSSFSCTIRHVRSCRNNDEPLEAFRFHPGAGVRRGSELYSALGLRPRQGLGVGQLPSPHAAPEIPPAGARTLAAERQRRKQPDFARPRNTLSLSEAGAVQEC